MRLKLTLSLLLSGASLLAACQTLPPAAQFAPTTRFQSFSTPRSDWFTALSPQLQQHYAPARGKTGIELFKTLSEISARGQHAIGYQESKAYMYATVDQIVAPQRRQNGVLDHYSYVFVAGQGGNGNTYTEAADDNRDGTPRDFINCEHTWPQSFFNKVEPMVSDLHHMFPTLSKPNAMRSNYPFGMSTGRQIVYSTSGSAHLSVVDKSGSMNPAEIKRIMNLPYEQQPHDLIRNQFDIVFEPQNIQKGNTARAMLYFYLRYYRDNIRAGGFNEQNFWDSKVPMFIEWSDRVDPIDGQERQRHELAARRQGNRNPFIDIPNLASLIGAEVFQKL